MGIGSAIFIILMVLVLADRLFLVAIKAKEIDLRNHDLYFLLQNLSCLKGLEGVRLYKSFTLSPNVYCIHPYFNAPCIVMSEEILRTNDRELWETSLEVALNQIQSKRGRFSTFLSFLTSLIFLPNYLFRSIGLGPLASVYCYLFLPFIYIKDFVVEQSLRQSLDLESERDTIRLTYYLEKFGVKRPSFINDLANDLSLFRRRDASLWPSILGSYANFSNEVIKWHERKN